MGKATAMDGQLFDELSEVMRDESEIIEIVVAVKVDPATLLSKE